MPSIITELLNQDFTAIIMTIFIIMCGVIAIAEIIGKFSILIGKPVRWVSERQGDHKSIKTLKSQVTNLISTHKKDIDISNKNINKLIKSIEDVKNETEQYALNRIHDREQSREIQKELTDSIKQLNILIGNIVAAQKELLAERINDKYKYYLNIKGIPEDEYDEFVNLHKAYNGVGGNCSGDAKFNYCIKHLPILSVKTKLMNGKE